MTYNITENIYREISKLTNSEKTILLTKLIAEISVPGIAKQNINIYDLKGIGKEVWGNIDAQDYINSERASW